MKLPLDIIATIVADGTAIGLSPAPELEKLLPKQTSETVKKPMNDTLAPTVIKSTSTASPPIVVTKPMEGAVALNSTTTISPTVATTFNATAQNPSSKPTNNNRDAIKDNNRIKTHTDNKTTINKTKILNPTNTNNGTNKNSKSNTKKDTNKAPKADTSSAIRAIEGIRAGHGLGSGKSVTVTTTVPTRTVLTQVIRSENSVWNSKSTTASNITQEQTKSKTFLDIQVYSL